MNKLRATLSGATILAVALPLAAAPGVARAQPITGLYIGGGLGYSILGDQNASVDKLPGRSSPPLSLSAPVTLSYSGGLTGIASIGYGVGNGVRLEAEAAYRSNSQAKSSATSASSSTSSGTATSTSTSTAGSENKYGVMLNALYDFNIGERWIFPYAGLGFGYQLANWKKIGINVANIDYGNFTTSVTPSGTIGELAYQAILGASFPITYVPGLAVTAEYRYLGLAGNRSYSGDGSTAYISTQYTNNKTKVHVSNDSNHTFMIGFRYAFDPDGIVETPSVTGAPYPSPVVPAPQAQVSRMYLIFFDFDRADLTPRARDIVAEAVRNSGRIPHTRIEVSGHADRSGDTAYNLRLGQARAEAVAAEMGRWGVPRSVMDIHSYGDSRPLVPTEAGVREPQNRRVEIVYR